MEILIVEVEKLVVGEGGELICVLLLEKVFEW